MSWFTNSIEMWYNIECIVIITESMLNEQYSVDRTILEHYQRMRESANESEFDWRDWRILEGAVGSE